MKPGIYPAAAPCSPLTGLMSKWRKNSSATAWSASLRARADNRASYTTDHMDAQSASPDVRVLAMTYLMSTMHTTLWRASLRSTRMERMAGR
jgi:hypothetical protein